MENDVLITQLCKAIDEKKAICNKLVCLCEELLEKQELSIKVQGELGG